MLLESSIADDTTAAIERLAELAAGGINAGTRREAAGILEQVVRDAPDALRQQAHAQWTAAYQRPLRPGAARGPAVPPLPDAHQDLVNFFVYRAGAAEMEALAASGNQQLREDVLRARTGIYAGSLEPPPRTYMTGGNQVNAFRRVDTRLCHQRPQCEPPPMPRSPTVREWEEESRDRFEHRWRRVSEELRRSAAPTPVRDEIPQVTLATTRPAPDLAAIRSMPRPAFTVPPRPEVNPFAGFGNLGRPLNNGGGLHEPLRGMNNSDYENLLRLLDRR